MSKRLGFTARYEAPRRTGIASTKNMETKNMEPQSNHETPKQNPGTPTLGHPPELPAWTPRAQETWTSDRKMGGEFWI